MFAALRFPFGVGRRGGDGVLDGFAEFFEVFRAGEHLDVFGGNQSIGVCQAVGGGDHMGRVENHPAAETTFGRSFARLVKRHLERKFGDFRLRAADDLRGGTRQARAAEALAGATIATEKSPAADASAPSATRILTRRRSAPAIRAGRARW